MKVSGVNLFWVRIIQILVIVIVLFVSRFVFRKECSKKLFTFLGISVFLIALLVCYLLKFVPPITESISITALGEGRERSQNCEVIINGFTVDGKEYKSDESLIITDGHWFWSGETYVWRPEWDSRQPKKTTRSITIEIPVGWNRTLNFNGNAGSGKVIITNNNKSDIIDTYSEEPNVKCIGIPKSAEFYLIQNQLRYILIYSLVLISLSSLLLFILYKLIYKPIQSKIWLQKHFGKLIYIIIALSTFVLMIYWSGKGSFNSDEMCQIVFSKDSFKEAIQYCLDMVEVSPPLSSLIYTLWYKIAPYGDSWTLLVGIILSAISIVLVGLTGEKIQGKFCGILSALFIAYSKTFWVNVAYEFRAYPILVFFSALTLYCYVHRNEEVKSFKWSLLLSFSMFGMVMSHYFGMLACFGFFIADIYLLYKKHLKLKNGFVYFLPGITSAVWLCATLLTVIKNNGPGGVVTWQPVPDISNIKSLLEFLTGNIELTYGIFFMGISFAVIDFIKLEKKNLLLKNFYLIFFLALTVCSIVLLYIWGNFISQKYTMWSPRYFLFLMPEISILSTSIFWKLNSCFNKAILCVFIGIVLSLNCFSFISQTNNWLAEPYREAADWIYTQSNDIFNDDTLIVTSGLCANEGWNDYYFSRKGRRDALNVKNCSILAEEDLKNKYKRIYVFSYIDHYLQGILDENYSLSFEQADVRVKIYDRR